MKHVLIDIFCEVCQEEMELTEIQPLTEYWTFVCNECESVISVKVDHYPKPKEEDKK